MTRWRWVNKVLLGLGDAAAVNLTVLIALWLRFDGAIPARYLYAYLSIALFRTVVALVLFYLAGLYRSLWRYASLEEFAGVVRIVSLNSLLFGAVVVFRWVPGFPRSVVLVAWILDVAAVAGIRLLIRIVRRAAAARRGARVPERKRVLIVGAGAAGVMVARELLRHEELRTWPVGFVDDDVAKQRMRIAGVEVLGTRADLVSLIAQHAVDEVIIAMPSAPPQVVRAITEQCSQLVALKIVPGVFELIDGKVTLNQIRPVRLEDLLGREPVRLDQEEIASYLRGQRVLVTGAGGSIGAELCRQIGRFRPAALILLGNEENSIYEIELELRHLYPDLCLEPVIANIRDAERMARVFGAFRPEVVFHAAAHKHVPLMECHPDEAVKNNVLGTRILAGAAQASGVRRFVLISTDKAVNPSSVMGASKRVAEMILQYRTGGPTRFMAVRFGNVLGSRGSVVPVFQDQIARGGPVTVTHPDMVRYFMTIPEAAQLVIQAGAQGGGGEVFVLDMGQPVRIVDLAHNLIRMSGLEPERDIPVVITGIRPGEKLAEELLTAEEGTRTTRHSRIYTANGSPGLAPDQFEGLVDALLTGAEAGDGLGMIRLMQQLIPTYRPPSRAAAEAAAAAEPGMAPSGGRTVRVPVSPQDMEATP